MSQRIIVKASVTLAGLLVLAAPVIRAQDNCQSFRLILPLTLDINTGWSGPVYGVMGTEALIGKWSDLVPPQTSCDTVSCQSTAARSLIDFGGRGLMNPGDTVTIEVQAAQYPLPAGYGTYHATWKIVGGTGRFTNATGMAFESGPFVAWFDDKNIPQTQYNGDVDGGICGVKPRPNPSGQLSVRPMPSTPAAVSPWYPRQVIPGIRK